MRKYATQVLEELDTEQADVFRSADDEIIAKETLLRYCYDFYLQHSLYFYRSLKEEIGNEKKMQENLLRDMRMGQQSTTQPAPVQTGKSQRR